MRKAVIVLLLICVLLSQLGTSAFAALGKASEWAVPELTEAEAFGLIPNSIKGDMSVPITRKEFAEVCIRVYELTTNMTAQAAPNTTFTDTKDVNVLKAFNLGIVTGIGEGKFGPDLTTNREQIATMLNRLLNALTPGMHTFSSENTSYMDDDQISSWAKESVDRASQLQFITGWNSQFDPKGLCTREMAVIIAKRVYGFYNGQEALNKGTLNKMAILEIAERYYQKTIDGVEEKAEFSRVINFTPDFSGGGTDPKKAENLSIDAASLIAFTDAKNMYTAFAAAVFTLDPDSAVTANNLAAAIASYNDRLLESGDAAEEIYQDAASVWLYSLEQSEKEGELTSESLSILVSLGNLYLDTNQFKQAFAAFSEAYQFDKNYSGARIGLMNYYLAKGDLENALKYADGQGSSVFAQKLADIGSASPVLPENEIYKYNPYEYSNYLDFFVQRLNVSALQKKMQVLPIYSMKVNNRIQAEMNMQIAAVAKKVEELNATEADELEALQDLLKNNEQMTELEKARRYHQVHESYRPQKNNAKSVAFNQLTMLTTEAYLKQIKPNAEKVYNDCMGKNDESFHKRFDIRRQLYLYSEDR